MWFVDAGAAVPGPQCSSPGYRPPPIVVSKVGCILTLDYMGRRRALNGKQANPEQLNSAHVGCIGYPFSGHGIILDIGLPNAGIMDIVSL